MIALEVALAHCLAAALPQITVEVDWDSRLLSTLGGSSRSSAAADAPWNTGGWRSICPVMQYRRRAGYL